MQRALAYLAVLSLGIFIGWLSHRAERVDVPKRDSVAYHQKAANSQHASSQVAPAIPHATDAQPQRERQAQPLVQARDIPAHSTQPARLPIGETAQDSNNVFPSGRQHDASDAQAADGHNDDLAEAMRISCQFDPGYTANWYTGSLSAPVTAAWQGGLITYDITDLNAGAAVMSGTQGATGSSTGAVKVHVSATNSGLSFSTFVPRGDLMTTTVFAALDEQGRHRAVMSTHGQDTHASQFYGSCDAF